MQIQVNLCLAGLVQIMMTVVITMAGLGSRFQKAGYQIPKYMIEVHGKTLFDWSMDSLKGYNKEDTKYIFIVRQEDHAADFIRDHAKEIGISDITLVEIEQLTDGQATTAMLAAPYWDKNSELMIYNIDTYVERYELKAEDIKGDGYIPCFHAPGDHWSFVKLDENHRAVEVREKQRISDNCTLGAYYFKSCGLYEQLYEEYYSSQEHLEKGEKYVAPLYNYMIEKGMDVRISLLDFQKVHVLGTPEELAVFQAEKIGAE